MSCTKYVKDQLEAIKQARTMFMPLVKEDKTAHHLMMEALVEAQADLAVDLNTAVAAYLAVVSFNNAPDDEFLAMEANRVALQDAMMKKVDEISHTMLNKFYEMRRNERNANQPNQEPHQQQTSSEAEGQQSMGTPQPEQGSKPIH